MPPWSQLVFVLVVVSTLFCTAVNCYTFQLTYPLWQFAGDQFAEVHREYMRRLNWIVTAPHVVMFFSSLIMIFERPPFVGKTGAIIEFAFNAGVVGISAFAAGPVHDRFTRAQALDRAGLKMLIRISALRTILMLAASGLIASWLLTR